MTPDELRAFAVDTHNKIPTGEQLAGVYGCARDLDDLEKALEQIVRIGHPYGQTRAVAVEALNKLKSRRRDGNT